MIESDHPHLCEADPIAPSPPFWFYPLSVAKVRTMILKQTKKILKETKEVDLK
jgi:hypothetical protein